MYDSLAEDTRGGRRITGLVQYCQRVLVANIDAITGFGEDMPHRLVRPILQGCNADTLSRLEQETPHIVEHNEVLWKELCFRSYPVAAEQYTDGDCEEPESWKTNYFLLKENEARRLEEAATRIRNQRLEAEEMKRKRQVKLTDRLPPPKRVRHGWSAGPTPPKTLFEKTRREATKIQKTVLARPILPPPIVSAKGYRTKLGAPSAQLLPPKEIAPVTITTVRSSCATPQATSARSKTQPDSHEKAVPTPIHRPRPSHHTQQEARTPPKPLGPYKKDPMASLFLPKQRMHSQLPNPVPSPETPLSR